MDQVNFFPYMYAIRSARATYKYNTQGGILLRSAEDSDDNFTENKPALALSFTLEQSIVLALVMIGGRLGASPY